MTQLAAILTVASAMSSQPAYEPTENYTAREIEGWKVLVNKRLLDDPERTDLRDQTLRLLEVKLCEINRTVPGPALEELHKVPIWIEAESDRFPCACYHPSADWLREYGLNPEKAGSVEIANPATFIDWTHEQPWMVLHELAHAYHHIVLGHDNETIKEGYRRAVESGSYESVLHWDGNTVRAYALNNDQEYFAELSEAFFGTNDFYPFVRAEVEKHDRWMYGKLFELWQGKPAELRASAPTP